MGLSKVFKNISSIVLLVLLVCFVAACSRGSSKKEPAFTVSTVSSSSGVVNPASTIVSGGGTATFEVVPNIGFVIDTVSGCGGSLNGADYITGVVTSACTVTASFIPEIYSVTTTVGDNGDVTPTAFDIAFGESASLTMTPDEDYVVGEVSGCDGTLENNIYTIGQITSNCEISASFVFDLADGEVLAEDYYGIVTNTVLDRDIGEGEQLLSFYTFENSNQLFQIGYSRNNGVTYHLLMPDIVDVSTNITDGSSAYPASVIYGESQVLLFVRYRTVPDTSVSRKGMFVIDRETLEMVFVPVPEGSDNCSAADGYQNVDGSWLFVGHCNEEATIYRVDENLENLTIVKQLTADIYGGRFNTLVAAGDGCLYAGGHNWEIIGSEEKATHINIQRSCDQGDTWTLDLDYYNAGQAYTSVRDFFELNNQLQFFGAFGEGDGGSGTDVSVITASRNAVNDWTFSKLPGTTVPSYSPASYIAVEESTCLMLAVSVQPGSNTYYSVSNDCGLNWGDPILTDFGRVRKITLIDGVASFYHSDSEYHVDQIDLN